MTDEDFLMIIEKAVSSRITSLDLSERGVKRIPSEIAQIVNLESLNLGNNQIRVIPDEIAHLANLKELYLHNNQINIIPDAVTLLSNLQILYLSNNQIHIIPDTINQLSNLQSLFLSINEIHSIPDSLSRLTKLKVLDLQSNNLPIPIEILNNYNNPKAIFDFWLEQPRQPLNEAKVILVGQGTVGKTSLVKRLLDNQFDTDERKTDGINIRDWQITAKNEQVKLRVWDFGGQEIMHATHQFFLTERSLYLLVINTREDELANRIEYWLKLIESLGNQAPVIIIGNKIDDHPLDLDRHGLQTKYPNIKGFIGTSCATGLGISELKQKITAIIANEMPHVFDPIPVKWLNLKDKLEQDDRDYITYQEYEQKCIETGITRESSRHTLVRLLHELGIILNFADDKRLKDTNVLNPEWVTVGAYRVINDNLLMTEHKGVLHWQDSARIFQPKSRKDRDDYPTEESRKFILRMMEKFELCFPMEDHNHQDYPDYLIPDLLPKEEPDTGEWKECLNFEYHYDKVLPNSVISRFIVKSHDLIARTNYRTYWRTGVILANKEGNKAKVKADLEEKKIFIHISGNSPTRRSFLSIIRHTFDQIHDRPKLTPDERVCLPDQPKQSVSYDHLLYLESEGEISVRPEKTTGKYNIRELLDGVEDRRSRLKDDFRERYNQPNPDRAMPQEPTPPTPSPKPPKRNPWTSGSFYLFALAVGTAGCVIAINSVPPIFVPVVIIAIILVLIVVGIFQLLNDEGLEQDVFERIIHRILKTLPFLKRDKS
jgi:small GTP-binding protein